MRTTLNRTAAGRPFLLLGVLALALAGLTPSSADAQTISGRVRDAATMRDMQSVLITAVDSLGEVQFRSETNSDGQFFLNLRNRGTFVLEVESLGYAPVSTDPIEVGPDPIFLEIELEPAPVETEGLVVSVEVQSPRLRQLGFYERKQRGTGVFIGPEDLVASRTVTPGEIFRRSPGMEVSLTGEPFSLRTTYGALGTGGARGCQPTVVVDNAVRRRGGAPIQGSRGRLIGGTSESAFQNVVPPAFEIAAMEFYHSSAGAPGEWVGLSAACGIVLVWTKGGR